MIYDPWAKEDWLSSSSLFLPQNTSLSFSASSSAHAQSWRDTRLLAYLPGFTNVVLCCTRLPTSHSPTVLIHHQQPPHRYNSSVSFLCLLSLFGNKGKQQTLMSLLLCLGFFQERLASGWRWSQRFCRIRAKPSTYAVPSLMPLESSSPWSDTHRHDTVVFLSFLFQLGLNDFLIPPHSHTFYDKLKCWLNPENAAHCADGTQCGSLSLSRLQLNICLKKYIS